MGIKLCEYGCGQEAKFQMTSGKWCCEDFYTKCPRIRNRNSETNKIKQLGEKNAFFGKKHSEKTKEILRSKQTGKVVHTKKWKKELSIKMLGEKNPFFGKTHTVKTREIISKARQLTISKIKKKYPTFYKEEEMKYNPFKPGEKEIQVHCKNHNCPNSKEQGGWFTPTNGQFYERKRQLESTGGQGGCYFYCSQKCKDECPLFNLVYDPFKDTELPYTYQENQIWRKIVLEEDKGLCQYCGEKAIDVHHIKPVKTHPHLALDPDNGISFCKECHYKIGHKTGTECSTGNLANKICINLTTKRGIKTW